jgi:hypothetical protein
MTRGAQRMDGTTAIRVPPLELSMHFNRAQLLDPFIGSHPRPLADSIEFSRQSGYLDQD